jgi:hypothetical protein
MISPAAVPPGQPVEEKQSRMLIEKRCPRHFLDRPEARFFP